MPCANGVTLLSACNCGRRQFDRVDPFSVSEANFRFYADCEVDCCQELERVPFPVFQQQQESFG